MGDATFAFVPDISAFSPKLFLPPRPSSHFSLFLSARSAMLASEKAASAYVRTAQNVRADLGPRFPARAGARNALCEAFRACARR